MKDRIRPRQPAGTYDPDRFPTAEPPAFAWEETESRMMRVQAVVQARMTSSRLPGKVLRPLDGKPMLLFLLERIARCNSLSGVVVATSEQGEDDAVAEECRRVGVPCFRGDLDDVAARFAGALRCHPADAFVRVNADSPLLDPALVDQGVALYRSTDADLISNVFPRSFPPGQSVEVVRTATFLEALDGMSGDEREHVTLHFYRNAPRYQIRSFAAPRPYGGMHMAVDTEADWERFRSCVAAMERPHWYYGLEELTMLWLGERAGEAP
ncbi:NTP transferase domain-containing protein [Azospirillum brasilense]|nr:NTP transferase domain-containing protein [Azospirillum brasilense]